uniref:Trithorax group protein osa n=1 Tax=Bursaphelenchus xylophilus TaxID=6326 RepID=A0A1I7RHJ0_BURXY
MCEAAATVFEHTRAFRTWADFPGRLPPSSTQLGPSITKRAYKCMDGQTVVQPVGAELNGVPNGGMFPPGANQYPCWSQGGPQQHRPEMPSTSNGAPMQFQDPSPNFYNAGGMAPPNSAPPSVGYFNQQQPYFNNMQGMPNQRPPGTPEFQPPPSYNPQMARANPMNPVQRPQFPQQPPLISRGMSNPQLISQRNSYVFTTDMLNLATQDVKQGRYPGLVQWHQARQMSQPNPVMNHMMDNGQRNSPSFPSAQQPNRSLKRKNTAQSDHNPSPSPQSMQNVDFKQPMSNQNPQDIKQEPNTADENNPLKKMEIMASFSNEPPTKNMKTEISNGKSKEEKMAKLDEIQRSLEQPQFHPNMRFRGFPGPYPPNQIPPQFMNGQNFIPQGYNPQMQLNGMPQGMVPNGMPPSSDPSQMSSFPGQPMNAGPMPQNGFQGHMNSPRFMGPNMGQAMMGMPGNDRPMPGVPYQPGMEMNMSRGLNPQEQYAWNQNMPQPLTNLDSRVPNQKMQYYGNGQPPMGGPMPPPASSSTT